jgi:septum site-determining protein MinC
VFKGTNNGISIWLDERAGMDTIKNALRSKTHDAREFFEDAEVSISFSGRQLNKDDESALLDIIFKETDLNVSYVESLEADSRLAPSSTLLSKNEMLTFFYEGALRNGQSIRYDGSVVIFGDANPGSEIIAKGNIIVMGALKGLVHAGCTGDTRSYVSALRLCPTQLRICDIITYIPEEKKNKNKMPSYAYLQEGLIYIATLVNI